MCKNWMTPADLGSVVSRSLIQLIKNTPATGWIKADQVASMDATKEILRLRQQVDELQNEVALARTTAPKGSELLAQGDEDFLVHFAIRAYDGDLVFRDNKVEVFDDEFSTTWNNLFSVIAPTMIDECSEKDLRKSFSALIREQFERTENKSKVKRQIDKQGLNERGFSIKDHDFQTIKIQLRALGLITMSQRDKRSIKDTDTYWTLTPYGDQVMNMLRAIRRSTG